MTQHLVCLKCIVINSRDKNKIHWNVSYITVKICYTTAHFYFYIYLTVTLLRQEACNNCNANAREFISFTLVHNKKTNDGIYSLHKVKVMILCDISTSKWTLASDNVFTYGRLCVWRGWEWRRITTARRRCSRVKFDKRQSILDHLPIRPSSASYIVITAAFQ